MLVAPPVTQGLGPSGDGQRAAQLAGARGPRQHPAFARATERHTTANASGSVTTGLLAGLALAALAQEDRPKAPSKGRRHRVGPRRQGADSTTATDVKEKVSDLEAWRRGYDSAEQEVCYTTHSDSLPADLRGTYFRNGPAKFNVGPDQIMHPFDGDGMVSAVTFDSAGGLHFRSRFVRTKGFVEELAAGRMVYRGQFSLKPGGWARNIFDMRVKNVANTSVLHWGGRLLALWEGGRPHELERKSLATLGESSLAGALADGDAFTAHPRYDSHTGRLVGFQYKPDPVSSKTKVSFWEFSAEGWELASRIDHDLPGFGFYHDLLVTEDFYILSKAPVDLRIESAFQGFLGLRSLGEAIAFDSARPTQLVLVPRDGSPLRYIDLDTHFCFHYANGFQADGKLVVDMVQASKLYLGEETAEEQEPVWVSTDLDAAPTTQLWRYTISLDTGAWSKQCLSRRHVEFPSVARAVSGRPHRYVYCGTALKEEGSGPIQGLLKVDAGAEGGEEGGAEALWLPEAHEFLGEPLFCPRVGAEAEDDGYIVSLLLDGREKKTDVVVFDAQDIAAGPISRVRLPAFLPHGLHGCWAADVVPDWADIEKAWRDTPTSLS